MPKNVIHQMHQLLIEEITFLEFRPTHDVGINIKVHNSRNNNIIAGYSERKIRQYLHFDF